MKTTTQRTALHRKKQKAQILLCEELVRSILVLDRLVNSDSSVKDSQNMYQIKACLDDTLRTIDNTILLHDLTRLKSLVDVLN